MMKAEISTGEPIRILHMIGSFEVGGSQALVINLYKAIDRNKIQFDFIVDHPDRMELASVVQELGARIFYMPTFVGKNILQVKKAWNNFFKEHPEYKILHSHVRSYASVYLPIAKKHGLKTIIHSHSTSNGSGITSVVKRIMQYPLRHQADYFFGCSVEAGKWLFGEKIVKSEQYYLLKNAIDVNAYRYDPEKRIEYRKLLGVEDAKVFVHVGRFHPAKNHMFLLEVYSEIHRQNQNTVLVLIGDGDLKEAIQTKIQELNLSESVIMLGNRKDVPELLQAADCFLFPSLYEGLGIVAIEAQAAGLPCVCAENVPRLVNVSDDCYFAPFDVAQWVEIALKTQAIREDMYQKIAEQGFDVKESAKWLTNFYLKIWEK